MSENTQVDVRKGTGLETQGGKLPVWQPAVDILEEPARIVVIAEMPGVGEGSVEVTVENRVLTLRGTPAGEAQDEGLLRREFGPRLFERSFTLGHEIATEGIEATITDGLLKVVLPKSAEHAPRRVAVRAS